MRKVRNIGALLLILLVFINAKNAQAQVSIDVKIDTTMMLIGDQTNVVFEASFPESYMVGLPVFSDTIIDKLEILNIGNIDTLVEDDIIRIKQEYLVTSFDSGWYEIPPLDFVVGIPSQNTIDTLKSNPIYYGVMTMPLDTANANAIADIKAPIDAPITVQEVLPFVGIWLGVLLLAFIIFVLYKKIAKKEPVFVKKEKPKVPAHITAFNSLDSLKEEKLWQKGQVKAYYSRLTEIVRIYIEDRYDILAMESTTDEIIDAFSKDKTFDKELKNRLFDTLVQADFVKFAKANPLADENEKNMAFAYDFVSNTKVVEALRDEDENTEPSNA